MNQLINQSINQKAEDGRNCNRLSTTEFSRKLPLTQFKKIEFVNQNATIERKSNSSCATPHLRTGDCSIRQGRRRWHMVLEFAGRERLVKPRSRLCRIGFLRGLADEIRVFFLSRNSYQGLCDYWCYSEIRARHNECWLRRWALNVKWDWVTDWLTDCMIDWLIEN